jgi:hypothetical protein
MIVSKVFIGDDNEVLKHAQHDVYGRNVYNLFAEARYFFNQSNADHKGKIHFLPTRFDHRILQDGHDIIAAAYRYQCRVEAEVTQPSNEEQRRVYSDPWSAWYLTQLALLMHDPQMARSVVEAVMFTRKDDGYRAEHDFCKALVKHYRMYDWPGQVGYVKSYCKEFVSRNKALAS